MMLKVLRYVNFPTSNYFIRHKHTFKNIIMKNEWIPPCRSNPIIKKLNDPLFHSLFTPELNTLAELFKKYNYELRIVGGAVRDILMGIKPTDLDFATDATPENMKSMFTKENIRMINTNGQKHGTITSRINDKENFEITTLRIDIATDGRKAIVQFTKDWKLDALRRDLTINSMFLDLEGKLYDYFYGYDDLQKKKIVFVGNASQRIKEDYLRILRYFRFYGKIAEQPDLHDEETITAIKENIQGLQDISGERIWSEWSRILSGNYAKELTLKMLECDMARYIGLPEDPNIREFEIVCDTSKKNHISLQPITLLSSLLRNQDEILKIHKRLKFSAYERDLAFFLARLRDVNPPIDASKYYKKILVHWNGNHHQAKSYIYEALLYKQQYDLAQELNETVIPRFPVNGNSVKEHVKAANQIGVVIRELKNIWLDNDFKITAKELLDEVPRIVSELHDKNCYPKV